MVETLLDLAFRSQDKLATTPKSVSKYPTTSVIIHALSTDAPEGSGSHRLQIPL